MQSVSVSVLRETRDQYTDTAAQCHALFQQHLTTVEEREGGERLKALSERIVQLQSERDELQLSMATSKRERGEEE